MLYLNSGKAVVSDLEAPKASSLRNAQPGNASSSEVDRVYAEIFDAVMDRRLLPGAKLTEVKLCSIFACSRTTVRAALSRLAYDRIVVLEPNRGAYVWQANAKETEDVFVMRRALERIAVDMLIALPDLGERLQPLYAMVERERKAFEQGDRISWIRLSNAFHVEMARLVGNNVLTEMLHSLCARTTLIIAYHDDTPNDSACSYIEHQDILDRLSQGDAQAARDAMDHHLLDCEQRVRDFEHIAPDPWAAFGTKI